MKVNVYAYYTHSSITEVELPEGKTWDDVLCYWVKWGTLFITWKDSETTDEFQLSEVYACGDYKRPDDVVIYDATMELLAES